jgi:hypothetical protein
LFYCFFNIESSASRVVSSQIKCLSRSRKDIAPRNHSGTYIARARFYNLSSACKTNIRPRRPSISVRLVHLERNPPYITPRSPLRPKGPVSFNSLWSCPSDRSELQFADWNFLKHVAMQLIVEWLIERIGCRTTQIY